MLGKGQCKICDKKIMTWNFPYDPWYQPSTHISPPASLSGLIWESRANTGSATAITGQKSDKTISSLSINRSIHDFFHNRTVIIPQPILITHIHIRLVSVWEVNFVLFNSMLKYMINRLMHAFFHFRTVIIPRSISTLGLMPSGQYGYLGMIAVLIWKRACINLYSNMTCCFGFVNKRV